MELMDQWIGLREKNTIESPILKWKIDGLIGKSMVSGEDIKPIH